MRLSLTVIAAATAISFCASARQSLNNVGVINIQDALRGTKDGLKATEDLDKKFLPEQKEFDTRQNEIIHLQEQYDKSSAGMSEAQRIQIAHDIDEKKKRLERDMQDAEADLKAQQQKVLQTMAGHMMEVMAKYAREHGFSVILDIANSDTPVLYRADAIDITQEVILLYDKSGASSTAAPVASHP